MNVKRTFGVILTVLGIIGLIFTAVGVMQHDKQITNLVVIGILGLLFFFTGISLIRTTADETK